MFHIGMLKAIKLIASIDCMTSSFWADFQERINFRPGSPGHLVQIPVIPFKFLVFLNYFLLQSLQLFIRWGREKAYSFLNYFYSDQMAMAR